MSKEAKKYTKDDIKSLMGYKLKGKGFTKEYPLAIFKGFIRIWQLQTADEKAIGDTTVRNGVGFSGYDGGWMTDIGNNVVKFQQITEGQYNAIKKNMHKYAGQLAKIANKEIDVPDFPPMKEQWMRRKNS